MKQRLITLLFCFVSLQIFSQPNCSPVLDEISIIGNDYRQNPVFSLSNLNWDGEGATPIFDGDGVTNLFDIGFASGVWAGGFDPSGNLKVAASAFGVFGFDYIPGPIWRDVESEALCDFFRRVWTINGDEIALLRSQFENDVLTIADIPVDILEWPALGNPYTNLPIVEDLAPFFDNNQDDIYDPLQGDFPITLEENPSFTPSQFRFYVFNDLTVHSETTGEPMDMEFQVMNWLVSCSDNDSANSETSVFTRLNYIHRGVEELRDFRIGLWQDNDLGCYKNDFAGCRPELDASYIYNINGMDPSSCDGPVEVVPPEIGVLKSSVILNRNLEKFMYIVHPAYGKSVPAIVDPTLASEYYGYLNGQWTDGTPLTQGGLGYNPGSTEIVDFAHPDLPTEEGGWSMQQEIDEFGEVLDVRTLDVFGVQEVLAPGATGTVDFADYVLMSEDNLGLSIFDLFDSSISTLREEYVAMVQGGFGCSGETSSVRDESQYNSSLSIKPNPAYDFVEVFLDAPLSGKLIISTLDGRQMSSFDIENENQAKIAVTDLDEGLYIITMRTYDGIILSDRFVKL